MVTVVQAKKKGKEGVGGYLSNHLKPLLMNKLEPKLCQNVVAFDAH